MSMTQIIGNNGTSGGGRWWMVRQGLLNRMGENRCHMEYRSLGFVEWQIASVSSNDWIVSWHNRVWQMQRCCRWMSYSILRHPCAVLYELYYVIWGVWDVSMSIVSSDAVRRSDIGPSYSRQCDKNALISSEKGWELMEYCLFSVFCNMCISGEVLDARFGWRISWSGM